MRKWHRNLRIAAVGMMTAGCASTQLPPPEETTVPEGPPIRQPGDAYVMYYANSSDLRVRNTSAGVDSVVITGARDVRGKASPDNSHLAVVFRQGDSSKVSMVDGVSGDMWTVHAAAGDLDYTLAWSSGSDALGVGYRPLGRGRSAVLMADLAGNVRNIGCSASNRFIAWRANGQVIVRDNRNVYAVDTRNCNTLATLPMRGKTEITYSANGNRVTFLRNGGLFVANYNGANTQGVAAARYRPHNVIWSPDHNKIVFEVNSQRFANITHIAFYDLSAGRAAFRAEERPLGIPRDGNPCWSPSGARLAHDRFFARRSADGQGYFQKQHVVTSASSDNEVVVLDELIRGEQPEAQACVWLDEFHLAVMSVDGPKILNVDTRIAYTLPPNSRLLYARVVD